MKGRTAWVGFAGLAAALALARPSSAEVELRVAARSQEIETRAELGSVAIEGVGSVSVFAQRQGRLIVLRAGGPDGVAIGRAEAPIGLARTPIAVQTPAGLETIVVVWGVEGAEEE